MTKLKYLVDFLAGLFLVSFLDGFLSFGFSQGVYVLIGIAEVVLLIMLIIHVHKKNK